MIAVVGANLLVKIGAGPPGLSPAWPLSLVNGYTTLGAASFALGLMFYVSVLRTLPLNVAQSMFAAQYVFVIFASVLLLGEPVSPLRWAGIALNADGIVIVGWTTQWS